ncbi:MAG: YtxH domain-containing protein [Microscillaceae bacterium]|nr:YtxH domain-containing protein [Microscillaceae bacterium]
MSSNLRLFFTFTAGVAVGLAAGLLLAPGRGDETRKVLANRAKAWREELGQNASVEKLSEVAKDALERISEYAEKIRRGQKELLN